jgi:hypothetical protein
MKKKLQIYLLAVFISISGMISYASKKYSREVFIENEGQNENARASDTVVEYFLAVVFY